MSSVLHLSWSGIVVQRGSPRLVAVTAAGHGYTFAPLRKLLKARRVRLDVWTYEAFTSMRCLPWAAYVLTDFDRLHSWQIELAARLYQALVAYPAPPCSMTPGASCLAPPSCVSCRSRDQRFRLRLPAFASGRSSSRLFSAPWLPIGGPLGSSRRRKRSRRGVARCARGRPRHLGPRLH